MKLLDYELEPNLQFGTLYKELATEYENRNSKLYKKPEEYIKDDDIDFIQLKSRYNRYSSSKNNEEKKYLEEMKDRLSYVISKMGRDILKSLKKIEY